MISNVSQIIPQTVSSTRGTQQQASDVATTRPAVVDSTQNTTATDNANANLAAANSNQPVSGASKELSASVDFLNANIQNLNRNLEFSLDNQSGEVLVKVVDSQTHEVIRQIPSKEAMELARNIERYMAEHHIGLLHQTKA